LGEQKVLVLPNCQTSDKQKTEVRSTIAGWCHIAFCCLLWSAGCSSRSEPSPAINVNSPSDLPRLVGQRVQLVGTVTRTEIPGILGVDVEELRSYEDRKMKVSGVLRQTIVTAEDVAKAEREMGGPFAHRGPGTYYYLDHLKYAAE